MAITRADVHNLIDEADDYLLVMKKGEKLTICAKRIPTLLTTDEMYEFLLSYMSERGMRYVDRAWVKKPKGDDNDGGERPNP